MNILKKLITWYFKPDSDDGKQMNFHASRTGEVYAKVYGLIFVVIILAMTPIVLVGISNSRRDTIRLDEAGEAVWCNEKYGNMPQWATPQKCLKYFTVVGENE